MGVRFGMALVAGPSSPAPCPSHWGVGCSLCLWRGLGLLGPSPFTSPFSPVSSQLPAPPKFNFHIRESWNSGRPWSLCFRERGGDGPSYPSPAPVCFLGMPFVTPFTAVCASPTSKREGMEVPGKWEQDGASFWELEPHQSTSESGCLRQGEALLFLCLSFPVWN